PAAIRPTAAPENRAGARPRRERHHAARLPAATPAPLPRQPQRAERLEPAASLRAAHADRDEHQARKSPAPHQPVARDQRRIARAMMINIDLERMGDLAEEIAERAIHLSRPPLFPIPAKLQRMTDLTTSMVHQSLDAFVNLNSEQAKRVLRMDDEVDRYNEDIIQEIIDQMQRSPELIDA